MGAKPGQPYRVIARLLHDAAGDEDKTGQIQDEASNVLFGVHNNNLGHRPLSGMLEPKYSFLARNLGKARAAWNKLHPKQPFPDFENPSNSELIEELAQAMQGVDRKKVTARIEGHPKEY